MVKLVVAAVIEREGRFLLCRRAEHKRHGGLWEFPGGKVESGESFEDALIRELNEELKLTGIEVGEELLAADDELSGFSIRFIPVTTDGEPQLVEHSALGWYELTEMFEMALAPSDRRFVEFLLDKRNQRV